MGNNIIDATVDAAIATAYSDADTERAFNHMREARPETYMIELDELRGASEIIMEMHRAWLRKGSAKECWHRPTHGKDDVYWAPFLTKYCCSTCFYFFNVMLEGTKENFTCDLCRKYVGVENMLNGLIRNPAIPQPDGSFVPVLLILFGVCNECAEATNRTSKLR